MSGHDYCIIYHHSESADHGYTTQCVCAITWIFR